MILNFPYGVEKKSSFGDHVRTKQFVVGILMQFNRVLQKQIVEQA
jgi:hypothetical protein